MNIGIDIAIRCMGFLDLLDAEERELAARVHEAEGDERRATAAMEAARRRLAREIESAVRRLPPLVGSDPGLAREIGYALAGLADERILHHPAGGLGAWRERLLEIELYGSALAGHEVIERAEAAAYARPEGTGAGGAGPGLLAPYYLALLRSGFEGELRGDPRRDALIGALVDAVGKPPAGAAATWRAAAPYPGPPPRSRSRRARDLARRRGGRVVGVRGRAVAGRAGAPRGDRARGAGTRSGDGPVSDALAAMAAPWRLASRRRDDREGAARRPHPGRTRRARPRRLVRLQAPGIARQGAAAGGIRRRRARPGTP